MRDDRALLTLGAISVVSGASSAPEALKRSSQVVKERWGESIGGNIIIGAWMALAMLAIIVVFAIGAVATNEVPAVRDAIIRRQV